MIENNRNNRDSSNNSIHENDYRLSISMSRSLILNMRHGMASLGSKFATAYMQVQVEWGEKALVRGRPEKQQVNACI